MTQRIITAILLTMVLSGCNLTSDEDETTAQSSSAPKYKINLLSLSGGYYMLPVNQDISLQFSNETNIEGIHISLLDATNNSPIPIQPTIYAGGVDLSIDKKLKYDQEYTLVIEYEEESELQIGILTEPHLEIEHCADTPACQTQNIDTVPPKLIATSIQDDLNSVSTTNPIEIFFDEKIIEDYSTTLVTLINNSGESVPLDHTISETRIVITPRDILTLATSYTLTINNTLYDLSNNYLPDDINIAFVTASSYDAEASHHDTLNQVSVISSYDGIEQPMLVYKSTNLAPLVVNLHTWSGTFRQFNPGYAKIHELDWNYIQPHFRGQNWDPEACLSKMALSDIDDAIQYGINNMQVDVENIFIVGRSGGGYAALGAYLKSRHNINAVISWVPLSSLEHWYHESALRQTGYEIHIAQCTESEDKLDVLEARRRSPLNWSVPKNHDRKLEIYAGIHDGHEGSVSISHSVNFYNQVANELGYESKLVSANDHIMLLNRTINTEDLSETIAGRQLLFTNTAGPVSLYIFNGGHEELPEHTVERLKTLAGWN